MRSKNLRAGEDRLLRYQKIIIDIVTKYLPDCTVYLFGSRARKTNLEGADIDIALDQGVSIALKTLTVIRDALEDSALPVFVDVVDYNKISDAMKKEIERDAITWKN